MQASSIGCLPSKSVLPEARKEGWGRSLWPAFALLPAHRSVLEEPEASNRSSYHEIHNFPFYTAFFPKQDGSPA